MIGKTTVKEQYIHIFCQFYTYSNQLITTSEGFVWKKDCNWYSSQSISSSLLLIGEQKQCTTIWSSVFGFKEDSVSARMCSHLRVSTQSSTQQPMLGKGHGYKAELESGPALLDLEGSHWRHKQNRVGQNSWGSRWVQFDGFLPAGPGIQRGLEYHFSPWYP